jgi:hypothetical protein
VFVVSGADLIASGGTKLTTIANFFVQGNTQSRGGVQVGAKDLDGDQFADIITGAGAGTGSLVRGYAGSSFVGSTNEPSTTLFSFDAFPGFTGGVFVG